MSLFPGELAEDATVKDLMDGLKIAADGWSGVADALGKTDERHTLLVACFDELAMRGRELVQAVAESFFTTVGFGRKFQGTRCQTVEEVVPELRAGTVLLAESEDLETGDRKGPTGEVGPGIEFVKFLPKDGSGGLKKVVGVSGIEDERADKPVDPPLVSHE